MPTCTLTKADDTVTFNTQELTQIASSLNNVVIQSIEKSQINVLEINESTNNIERYLGNKPNDVITSQSDKSLVQAKWFQNQDAVLVLTFNAANPTSLTLESHDSLSPKIDTLLQNCNLSLKPH